MPGPSLLIIGLVLLAALAGGLAGGDAGGRAGRGVLPWLERACRRSE